MRKMKKAAAYVMAAAMMFSMIGCGKKNEEATSATTATGSDAQTTQAAVIEDDGDWVTTEAALPDTRRFTIEEGSDAIGINFDDNDLHGFTTFAEGGVFDIEAKGGACEVNISGIGTAEHGCQVYFDGFAMANGCKYRMCFDITSSV